MRRGRKVRVFYIYDEKRAMLDVRYDEAANEVVVTGGRHAYAELTETFAIMAGMRPTYEDSRWNCLRSPDPAFEIVLDDTLGDERDG